MYERSAAMRHLRRPAYVPGACRVSECTPADCAAHVTGQFDRDQGLIVGHFATFGWLYRRKSRSSGAADLARLLPGAAAKTLRWAGRTLQAEDGRLTHRDDGGRCRGKRNP